MKYQTIIIMVVVLLILTIYWFNRKKIQAKKSNVKKFDLIIKFKSNHYIDIRNIDSMNKLANWSKYGNYGFRGFCVLNKEETENFIINNLNLNKKDFEVIKANPGLYLPS